MKNKWFILLAMVIILAFATYGANAYFSSQRTTTGHISSGTLTLKLSNDAGATWGNSVSLPWNFINMAPGDEVSGELYMQNIGTIASEQVTFEWQNILNNPDTTPFADHIFLTEVWDSKNTSDAITQVILMADGKMPGTTADGKCSLSELAYLSEKYGYPYDAVTDVEPFLPSNSPQYLHMAFQFDPEAGNEFQGVSLSYNLIITAEQVVVFP